VPALQLAVSSDHVTRIIQATIHAGTTVTDNSIHVEGTAGEVANGQGAFVQQSDVWIGIGQEATNLSALLGGLRAAVEQLAGHLPPEQLDAMQGLVDDLEEEAATPQPMWQRMTRALKGVSAIAGAAGQVDAAVIDAAQTIHRALGS
jgi:hypothetical protein